MSGSRLFKYIMMKLGGSSMPKTGARSAAVGAFLVVLGACGSQASPGITATDPGVTATEIKIGATFPLSGTASFYYAVAKGATAYFTYINKEKGGVNGRQINYVVLDDGYDPSKTPDKARELVQDQKVFATFGDLGTPNNKAVRDYYNAQKVPQLFVFTGASTVANDYISGWKPKLYMNQVAASTTTWRSVIKNVGNSSPVDGMISARYLKDPNSSEFTSDAGIAQYKTLLDKYGNGCQFADNFCVAGMAFAFSVVDVLRKAGTNLTRANIVDIAANQMNESDNFLVLPGIKVHTSKTHRFPISHRQTISYAANAYFNYVNGSGGIDGRKITLKILDDASTATTTANLTHQLVEQDKVFAIYGGLGTQPQASVREYMNTNKVPQIFVFSGATTWSADYGKFPWTIGWIPSYQVESHIFAKDILTNHPNAKVGVLYQNDDYGKDYLKGLTDGLGVNASMIVDQESAEPAAASPASQIFKLQANGGHTVLP